jgi:N-ethylmaleimide reductase
MQWKPVLMVELHAASGYLPNQFLVESANTRTDKYGDSVENRSRFVIEVMTALIDVFGEDKVGIKLSPTMMYNGIEDSDPIALFSYLITELNKMPIAYIHLMQPFFPFDKIPTHYPKDLLETFGSLTQKFLIFNGGLDRDTAENILENNLAQMVSFGSLYLANPDLPKRFEVNAEMNTADRATMFGGGEKGYIDYPFLEIHTLHNLN